MQCMPCMHGEYAPGAKYDLNAITIAIFPPNYKQSPCGRPPVRDMFAHYVSQLR